MADFFRPERRTRKGDAFMIALRGIYRKCTGLNQRRMKIQEKTNMYTYTFENIDIETSYQWCFVETRAISFFIFYFLFFYFSFFYLSFYLYLLLVGIILISDEGTG